MKPVLVGAAPGKNTDPANPLYPINGTYAGHRLMALMGLQTDEYLSLFDRRNVLNWFPGDSGKGDKFPMSVAIPAAQSMSKELVGCRVLFVGKAVAKAFQYPEVLLTWQIHRGFEAACLPHTSGVNHWYNDEENRRAARTFLAAFVEDTRSGVCSSF